MHQSGTTLEISPAPLSKPEAYSSERVASRLHQSGVAHVHQLLTDELLSRLYEEVVTKDQDDELSPAAIGRGERHIEARNIRRDKTQWIEGHTLAQSLLLEQLETIRLEMNKQLMLGLFRAEAHYAVYHPGDFYARHTDSFRGARNRILSLVIYLNKAWQPHEGGLLHLYDSDDAQTPHMTILPEYGHAAFFLSEDIPHEVTQAQRTRYSIAAWFHCYQPM